MDSKRSAHEAVDWGRLRNASLAIVGGVIFGLGSTAHQAAGKASSAIDCGPIICYDTEEGLPAHAHTGATGTPPWSHEYEISHANHYYHLDWHPEFREDWLEELSEEEHEYTPEC